MIRIEGVYTAVITPFTESDQLDEEGLRRNIRFQLKAGIDGIVALGTTGEAPTLNYLEKLRIIEICREETAGVVPLIVGTGSYSTQQTIQDTLRAKELGADAALVVGPYYNKPTQEGLFQHFTTVAEKTDFPLIVYNIEGRTGQNIQTSTLKRIIEDPRIISVKEASGSISQIMDVIQMTASTPVTCLSGDDLLTFPVMALGGHGVISVLTNLFPEPVVALVKAVQQGDFENARKLHFELLPLVRAMFIETNPMPVKAAMKLAGLPAGHCRLPLCELQPASQKHIQTIFCDYLSVR